ncbi:S-locus-specific glycoprotein S13 [Zea mays]|nr:S-locus-specific glycoprotein S13-like [Zea mays]
MTKTNTMRSHHHGYSHRHCHLLVQSSILLFLGTFAAAQAASDILSKGSNLTNGETLVSTNGSFTLGFFTRGVPARRYLGIWFTVANSSSDAVCWVANRDLPLGDTSGVLAISDTGSLVLLDGSGRTAWSSNTTAGAASPTVKLLESGNLVLLDGNGGRDDYDVVKLWQSFDHPTNTLLPGAKIGMNLWSGGGWSLTSWRDADDPSTGEFRYAMVRRGGLLPEIVMLDSSDAIKYRTGVWNGRWFSGIPEMNSYSNMFVFHVTVSQSEVSFSYAANAGAPPSLSRVLLNYTAEAVRVVWVPDKRGWANFFTGPREDCDHYNRCGHSGVCNQTAASTAWPCSCVQGFVPVSSSDWDGRDPSGGCRRNVSLDCGDNGTTDGFVRLPGVKLPDTLNSSLDTSITLDECRARCLANCSCVAYAAADVQGGGDDVGTGCIMWPENLTDLRYVAGGQTLYLRQATPPSGTGRLKKETVVLVAAGSTLGFIGLVMLAIFVVQAVRIRRRNLLIQMTEAVETAQDPSVSSIALATVKSATRNFSTRNVIGEGTFGIVYEGKLPRGHPLLHGLAGRTIAVKRLKPIGDLPDIIVRYFTREMQLMSGLKQHRNVLRLLAYCDEASERILVYEYMHRRSLDAYIFGTPRERALLNWCRRLQIIQGIADGVKHLHEGEGSAGNVIHRDLKPANVLLDGGWQAKVADFGTAKLLVAGATGTRTRIGTPGYMAPEYVQSDGGETTLKCDVYSFGVTLMETLSGRKNCDTPSLVSEVKTILNCLGRSRC